MINTLWPSPLRRDLLIGIGATVAARPGIAFACHERDHPPCHTAALLSMTGATAQIGQDAAAGIHAMVNQLQQTDSQRRGHLNVVIIDSASDPKVAVTEIERLMSGGSPPSAIIAVNFSVPPSQLARIGLKFNTPFIFIPTYASGPASEWVFRLSPSMARIAAGVIGYLEAAGVQRDQPVNIVNTASFAGRGAEFADSLAATGRRVGVRVTLLAEASGRFTVLETEVLGAVRNSAWIVSAPVADWEVTVQAIRRKQDAAPIMIDAGINDPVPFLRAIGAQNVVVLSPFDPELVDRRPLARTINERVVRDIGHPLTPAAAITATAVQVLAEAVVAAKVRDDDYGEATRDSLRAVSLEASELILPWQGIRFNSTLQNEGARVVALGVRENRIVTVWRAVE